MKHEDLFLRYLMTDKIYKKRDIQRNGWSIALRVEWGKKGVKGKYICEIKGNVYLMMMFWPSTNWEFKCKEAIISKQKKDKI